MAYPIRALWAYEPTTLSLWRCPADPVAYNGAGTGYLYAGFGPNGFEPLSRYHAQYVPVVWDLAPCHPGRSRNVAFLDGHVEPGWSRDALVVSPKGEWACHTGRVLQAGDRARLSAGGQWTPNWESVPESLVPPVGFSDPAPQLLCPLRPNVCLLASVEGKDAIAVGYSTVFVAGRAGELWLGMNDDPRLPRFWSDNAGCMWVFVTPLAAAPGPRSNATPSSR